MCSFNNCCKENTLSVNVFECRVSVPSSAVGSLINQLRLSYVSRLTAKPQTSLQRLFGRMEKLLKSVRICHNYCCKTGMLTRYSYDIERLWHDVSSVACRLLLSSNALWLNSETRLRLLLITNKKSHINFLMT